MLPLEHERFVYFVGNDIQVILPGELDDRHYQVGWKDGACRIRRAIDDEKLRPVGHLCGQVIDARQISAFARERIAYRLPAAELRHGGVIWPSRIGHKHLVAGIDERPYRAEQGTDRTRSDDNLRRADFPAARA